MRIHTRVGRRPVGAVVFDLGGVLLDWNPRHRRLLARFGLTPNTTLMIDDTKENLETASKLGFQTALFRSSRQLRAELEAAEVLARSLAPP